MLEERTDQRRLLADFGKLFSHSLFQLLARLGSPSSTKRGGSAAVKAMARDDRAWPLAFTNPLGRHLAPQNAV
jgi:hypothetical protein